MKTTMRAQSDQEAGHAPAAQRTTRRDAGREFIDYRPEAIAQRKLADAIDHSPYMVAQRQQLRRMFGETAQLQAGREEEELLEGKFALLQRKTGPEEEEVLQGKFAPGQEPHLPRESLDGIVGQEKSESCAGKEPLPLQGSWSAAVVPLLGNTLIQRTIAPDKFNVIGEKHTESDKRREDEISALKKNKCLQDRQSYWQEGTFSIVLGDDNKDRWGDDRNLRRESILAHVDHQASTIAHAQTYQTLQALEDVCDTAQGILDESNGVSKEAKEVVRRIQDLAIRHRALSKPSEDEKSQFEKNINGELSTLKIHRDLNPRDWKVVSKERSDYMHDSANLAVKSNIKGVWKVGDNHANDMNEKDKRQYALTSREEFDTVLNAYRKKLVESTARWEELNRKASIELPNFDSDEECDEVEDADEEEVLISSREKEESDGKIADKEWMNSQNEF